MAWERVLKDSQSLEFNPDIDKRKGPIALVRLTSKIGVIEKAKVQLNDGLECARNSGMSQSNLVGDRCSGERPGTRYPRHSQCRFEQTEPS